MDKNLILAISFGFKLNSNLKEGPILGRGGRDEGDVCALFLSQFSTKKYFFLLTIHALYNFPVCKKFFLPCSIVQLFFTFSSTVPLPYEI